MFVKALVQVSNETQVKLGIHHSFLLYLIFHFWSMEYYSINNESRLQSKLLNETGENYQTKLDPDKNNE